MFLFSSQGEGWRKACFIFHWGEKEVVREGKGTVEIFLGLVLATIMLSDLTTKLIHTMLVTIAKKFVFFYRGF